MAADSFRVLAVAGVGLLGGSVALAARQADLVQRVVGIGRNPQRLRAAVSAGIIDEFRLESETGTADWDLIVVATPVDRIVSDVLRLATSSRPGTVITDVGSVKQVVVEPLSGRLPADIEFVGAHPLAGSHQSGFEAARADLFSQRVTVVTPSAESSESAVERIVEFWQALGSRVIQMSAAEHDSALALTSHLPHVAAAALASLLQPDQRELAASGFRDTTRIAAGDADLWVPILLANAEPVLKQLTAFNQVLSEFTAAIRHRDDRSLRQWLETGRLNRQALDAGLQPGQSREADYTSHGRD